MMVTFVSQCEKNARKKTRRVLDAFADRIGDNTWQTLITEDGLTTVKKMLRQTASKSTAVSCHWIRSRSRSQLLWVVGSRSKFDARGVVPVNSTQQVITQFENDWHYLPLIQSLSGLAALFHDWGKATKLFQKKLKDASKLGDPIRHEWISCLLLHALIHSCDSTSDDRHWLTILVDGDLDEARLKSIAGEREQKPLSQLPPAAQMLAWLIVSHHRLPETSDDWRNESAPNMAIVLKRITQAWGYENRRDETNYHSRLNDCFEFPLGLLSRSSRWLKQVRKWATRMQDCLPLVRQCMNDGSFRVVLHHARLCLMLGDHHYSSQNADPHWPDTTGLFANTDRKTKKLKQKLDEHLTGVSAHALRTAFLLPVFEREPPVAQDIQSLKKPSTAPFRWQDKAVGEIKRWRQQHVKSKCGFFAVNMASTGCGKTFANAKVMRAISHDGESLRYILALGLRTLTLQTGDEYRERIGLDSSELAVLIGSRAIMELHQHRNPDDDLSDEQLGSESSKPLLDEEINFECDIPDEGLATVLTQERDRQFLYAPVLACTIDHMMAATETKRGGRYILPSLRLMSSDLVIDEVDDFTGSDLIAIGRLIHLAGMLGRKVIISSATIPPDLAEGYFNAYRAGWLLFSRTRDADPQVGCAWIDEFNARVETIGGVKTQQAIDAYNEMHQKFVSKRVKRLSGQPVKRRGAIIACQEIVDDSDFESESTKQERYFSAIQQAVLSQHKHHHTVDQKTGREVSFGVVRVANITPCIALSRFLMGCDWPEGVAVRVMPYHSQQVLLLRHEQEKHLDRILKRKESTGTEPRAFDDPVIRLHLDHTSVKHLLFVLVATPVEEVGRDHDFDWAVVEPSSYRSIIQLAGRVRRHRDGAVDEPNIGLLQYNWRTIRGGNQPGEKYFRRPGYEEKLGLETHNLSELIDVERVGQCVNAVPRIQKAKPLNPERLLADLEHFMTATLLTNYQRLGPEQLQGYLSGCWHLTALPQMLNPFRKSEPTTKVFLMYDPNEDQCVFIEKDDRWHPVKRQEILQIRHQSLSQKERSRLWLYRDYKGLLSQYAEQQNAGEKAISLRYGELNFIDRDNQEYGYSDQLGLFRLEQEE